MQHGLKYALVGPIGFIAAEHDIKIEWRGDETEPAIPDDLRVLHVRTIFDIGPRMRRIVFVGNDLQRYDRDDQLHCRLIFQPRDATVLTWPRLDHRGHVVWPGGTKIDSRVYTIREIDISKGEISIDFALHDSAGPATIWAKQAEPGDIVGILGPAAHGPKPASFYVLAGDETGLPGIARILERLPPDVKGFALIEIDSDADQLPLRPPEGITIQWLCRNGAQAGSTMLL
jgi:NADPH-dependent ferric siderophore reductase